MTAKNKKLLLFPFCCLLFTIALPQTGSFQGSIGDVSKAGFYQILVTPEISSHSRPDLSDLRIRTADGREVARILKTNKFVSQPLNWKEFTITSTTVDTSSSRYVCKAPPGLLISNLSFSVSSANSLRYASVSGSNDSLRWFSVTDHFLLDGSIDATGGNSVVSLPIPASKYLYYKLTIENGRRDPLQVLKIGTLEEGSSPALPESAFIANPGPVSITQTDSSNKRSYVRITFDQPYHVDALKFKVGGTKFFERSSELYNADLSNSNKKLPTLITAFTLSSRKPGYVGIPATACSVFLLVIENEDNPPLQIEGCETRQIGKSIVAWFDSGKKYTLFMGDTKLPAPDYDLEKFADSIPKLLPALSVGSLSTSGKEIIPGRLNSHTRWWIWPSIFLALLALGTLSWKLLQDVNQAKQ